MYTTMPDPFLHFPFPMDVIFEPQRGRQFTIEVGFFDTVLEIKEKVQKYQGIPVSKQTLLFNGQVLHDDRDVEFCEILQNSHIQLIVSPETDKVSATQVKMEEPSAGTESIPVNRLTFHSSSTAGDEFQNHVSDFVDRSEVDVSTIRPSPTSSASASGAAAVATSGSKKLKLTVLPKCGTKGVPVEVNASDNVGELRKELQKLNQRCHFHLPPEGYFFIYKQNVMDDDRSFRWHHVGQGDTIEIFNGSVTGGS